MVLDGLTALTAGMCGSLLLSKVWWSCEFFVTWWSCNDSLFSVTEATCGALSIGTVDFCVLLYNSLGSLHVQQVCWWCMFLGIWGNELMSWPESRVGGLLHYCSGHGRSSTWLFSQLGSHGLLPCVLGQMVYQVEPQVCYAGSPWGMSCESLLVWSIGRAVMCPLVFGQPFLWWGLVLLFWHFS